MTDEISFSIVHSGRKTVAVQVTWDGRVAVHYPTRVSDGAARTFAESREEWVEKYYREARERLKCQVFYPPQQVKEHRRQAARMLAERTTYWVEWMDMTYRRITIRGQVIRWRSCSAKGNLSYNWRLILVPEELPDYVVVHGLTHRRETNHSNRFWEIAGKGLLGYRQRRKALKGYGNKINS